MDRFAFEIRGERWIALESFILLFNLQSHFLGINQIRNVFMPLLERCVIDELGIEGGEGGSIAL